MGIYVKFLGAYDFKPAFISPDEARFNKDRLLTTRMNALCPTWTANLLTSGVTERMQDLERFGISITVIDTSFLIAVTHLNCQVS